MAEKRTAESARDIEDVKRPRVEVAEPAEPAAAPTAPAAEPAAEPAVADAEAGEAVSLGELETLLAAARRRRARADRRGHGFALPSMNPR